MKITRVVVAAALAAAGAPLAGLSPASASASGSVTCNGNLAVVGVWIQKVSGSGTSGWAWTPNDGSSTQDYYRENIDSDATYNVHVGCGGSPSAWQYTTTSVTPQSGDADWVCIPGYATGGLNRCSPS
ncbi:hypothetical protein AB0H83_12980 [Dactylosporangium sp. NPDC050688]|uniref:hypothetical protein n=1 Tax=Dactylosporangium sp. NPDC050688 TaxID=3157217 RepID=UPI0033F58737